jgi:cytosine/adenosine deaminase-related metal-dependent hydrolase
MLFAIWCATHHPNAKERISLEEAIIASAAMAGDYEKSKRGHLLEGAPADFVVMDPSSVDSLLKKELSQEEIREVIGSSEKIEDLTRELDEGVRAVIKSGKIVKALQKD